MYEEVETWQLDEGVVRRELAKYQGYSWQG